jgi:hypothetical protein
MKTEIYSWRLDPDLKGALEHAARSRGSSVARLLEEIVVSWLERAAEAEGDDEVQRRLHAEARKAFGTLEHGDLLLAEEAGERVRRKLRQRHATGGSR